jgi:ATP-dependent Lhr-like helicase
MITRVTDKHDTEGVLSLLHPVVAEWFRGKFEEVTEAQSMAVPLIHAHRNVLVSSPTGSGKTLTAFLSILNELILTASQGQLEDRIYAVYVSPLKALANDVNENLLRPLSEISALFESKGLPRPGVKVAVRTGDTLPSERQKQARSPPHIFITTPESLSLVLSTPVFSRKFEKVDYAIIDEVHEICDSKRGVALSVALERLQSFCQKELTRVGLSATVAPIEQVAEFLVGLRGGRPRDVSIVEVFQQRDLDLSVLCPARDMTSLSFEVVNSKMYDLLKEMIEEHRTTLVFTNTRSGTESVVYKLKERGLEQVGAHHGSLSRETRLDVEDELRGGLLRAVVSSTSLELGIDIGSIDLVVQIGSPKSVAKGLQRVGRAGHQYGGTSKGRIVVFESDDLVECAVLCRAAHRKMIDRVTIPMNSLDVLAQSVVGMSIERPWTVGEAFELIKRSYCYKDLQESQFEGVLKYLGGKEEFEGIYSKIWYDDKLGTFGKKHGSRMIYYLNQGTIPEEADYKVFSERGSLIGSLSEKFVERLSQGDIFVLGGRSYEFIKTKGTKAFVKSASGRKPTVPSWTGELLPRSFDLSVQVGRFRGEMDERLGNATDQEISAWLMKEFDVDEGSATTIINYFKEQRMVAKIPTDKRLLVEGYVDASGNRSAIFHFPFGRRVNDALSRAYASVLSQRLRCNVTVSVTDDNFMLTAPKAFEIESIEKLATSGTIERMLRSAVKDSELFSQRFRHTATRSFMVLRNYKGREMSVARQQLRSQRLLDALHELESFPVIVETYSEILTDVMDLEHATEVLESIESGERDVGYIPFSGVPSPFAHNVILVGISDIVLMEDRSMLLRELHRKVLARVLGEEAVVEYQFDPEAIAAYFSAKFPKIASKQDIMEALRRVGPMNLFREKGECIYAHSDAPFEKLRGWSSELLREDKVRSIWIGEDVYVATEDWQRCLCVHKRAFLPNSTEESILRELSKQPMGTNELADALGMERDLLRETLRKLEIVNAIYRSDIKGEAYLYSVAPPAEGQKKECIVSCVQRHVAFHAPITVEDLAYEVGVAEQETEDALRELVSKEVAVSGRFVVGEEQQYMLSLDYLRLQSKGSPSFDRDTIRTYSEKKQFSQLSSVQEFFDKFGEAGMSYDIFQRVKDFSLVKFGEMRMSGKLLLGRFVRGKLRYVLAEDAPHYLGVFRKDRLNKYELEILKTVERIGSGTYQELAEATGFPPDAMREHFDSLDRKGFLLRAYDEAESWSSRNVYTLCALEPEAHDPYSRVLTKYLRGFGPVTALQAAAYLDVEVEDARRLLDKVGAKSFNVGLERTEMFILPDEMPELETAAVQDDKIRILSLYDPFLSDKWTEITSRYGEGWIFPLVHRNRIVGMIEKWLMAGSVEIREIQLDEPSLLGELVDALDSMMPYYNQLNVDIVRVRSVFGIQVTDLDVGTKSEFLRRGYAEANGMLVKGRLVTPCFEQSEILSLTLALQNLEEGSKLRNMADALDRYGGIRSDYDAVIRVKRFESLKKLQLRGEVVRGHLIPDRVGYCTMEDASLYRAARQRNQPDDEKLVLRIVKDQQPVKRDRLLEISPLGAQDTLDALKRLYATSQVYMDASMAWVPTRRTKTSKQVAWARVVKKVLDIYGVISAESIAMLLGHEIPMREIRRALRTLEDEGHLVKGFLMRGSGTLYWASKDAVDKLGKVRFESAVVLAPWDSLVQFLRTCIRDLLPETGKHVIFLGPLVIGSFWGRVKGGRFEVDGLVGDSRCEEIISSYARLIGRSLREKEEGRLSDWEIMDFYQRSHPGTGRAR